VVHSKAEIDIYSKWLNLPPEKFVFVHLSAATPENESWQEQADEPYILALGTANRDYALLAEAVAGLGYKTIIVSGKHATEHIQAPANVIFKSGLPLEECHRLATRSRINVIPITLPPLRERREDISLIAEHFLHKYNEQMGKDMPPAGDRPTPGWRERRSRPRAGQGRQFQREIRCRLESRTSNDRSNWRRRQAPRRERKRLCEIRPGAQALQGQEDRDEPEDEHVRRVPCSHPSSGKIPDSGDRGGMENFRRILRHQPDRPDHQH